MNFVTQSGGFDLAPGGVLSWIVIGLIAGAIASRVVAGRGMGCLADLVVGVAGAFIGGFILSFFVHGTAGFFGSLLVAFLGASLLLAILQSFASRRF